MVKIGQIIPFDSTDEQINQAFEDMKVNIEKAKDDLGIKLLQAHELI